MKESELVVTCYLREGHSSFLWLSSLMSRTHDLSFSATSQGRPAFGGQCRFLLHGGPRLAETGQQGLAAPLIHGRCEQDR